jgi:hypothetical protein
MRRRDVINAIAFSIILWALAARAVGDKHRMIVN